MKTAAQTALKAQLGPVDHGQKLPMPTDRMSSLQSEMGHMQKPYLLNDYIKGGQIKAPWSQMESKRGRRKLKSIRENADMGPFFRQIDESPPPVSNLILTSLMPPRAATRTDRA